MPRFLAQHDHHNIHTELDFTRDLFKMLEHGELGGRVV